MVAQEKKVYGFRSSVYGLTTKNRRQFREDSPPKESFRTKESSEGVHSDNATFGETVNRQLDFFQLVYEVARKIPKGRVTSYGAIGKYLGSGKSARMVGWAMNAAHSALRRDKGHGIRSEGLKKPVPAHRVVNRNGELTGKHHFGHPDMMQKLLEKEGVNVKKDRVVNFEKLFWDPAVELKL